MLHHLGIAGVVVIQAVIGVACHGDDPAGLYIDGHHGAGLGLLTAGGRGVFVQVADAVGQSLLGGGLYRLVQGQLYGVPGNGLYRFLHPYHAAILVLHHGAQTVLPAQLLLHHLLYAPLAHRIAEAVARRIGKGIGLALLLQPVVFLGAHRSGDPQHMGGQVAGQVGADRGGGTVHAGQLAAFLLQGGQQRIADIIGKGIGVVVGKFRLGHGIADPRQQPLLLGGIAVHPVLRPQRSDKFLIGGGRRFAVGPPVQRFGIAFALYLIAGTQPVQHIGIGVVVQIIQVPQPVHGVLRGGGIA